MSRAKVGLNQDRKKRAAGDAALQFIEPDMVIGVGTGSTIRHFIESLKTLKFQVKAAVSSSNATSALLREARIEELELNTAGELDIYVDGADEATRQGMLIKGGGGALTREKVIAGASRRFVCIVDDSKIVPTLGRFPLPVEVIPMARSYVARRLVELGGLPVWRENAVTDNGNQILDVHNFKIADPVTLESSINSIAGVVCVGLFARRGADVLLIASDEGIETIRL